MLIDSLGMFLAAFGAATILPFQSEIVFVGLQLRGVLSPVTLVVVASIGNVLGAVANYALGRGAEALRGRRWFPVSEARLATAQRWYARWGAWTLLLSWAPFGDGFTVIAGMMRLRLWIFLALVTLAKTARYALLAWVTAMSS